MLQDASCRVKPHNAADITANVGLPFSDTGNFRIFSSAISNPPRYETESPALLFRKVGSGKVVYSAGLIEGSALRDNKKLFLALIRRLLGENRFILEAPEFIDYTVYTGIKLYRIGLLSYLETVDPVQVHDIKLTLMLDPVEEVESVITVGGTPFGYEINDNALTVKLSSLSVFEMIIVNIK
jgi:hypothetical protein